ncbi:MAG: hypothetical protein FWC10_09305 [Lentimicrobiaceae bacterium]|nr:hypothetical protein [Lentimicrobiaceae bacterium]
MAKVRFQNKKNYPGLLKMSVVNTSSEILASFAFQETIISDYYDIPAGEHIPKYNEYHNCLPESGTYNFKEGRKYTVVGDVVGVLPIELVFNVTDDGPF